MTLIRKLDGLYLRMSLVISCEVNQDTRCLIFKNFTSDILWHFTVVITMGYINENTTLWWYALFTFYVRPAVAEAINKDGSLNTKGKGTIPQYDSAKSASFTLYFMHMIREDLLILYFASNTDAHSKFPVKIYSA